MKTTKRSIGKRNKNGVLEYRSGGKLHRFNQRARVFPNGRKEYYFNGKLHRTDGPAIESAENKEWYVNGKRHRDDGPASIYTRSLLSHGIYRFNIVKEWFVGRDLS